MAPQLEKTFTAIDSHEERLQKVESTLQDVVVNVAELTVTNGYVKDAIEENREDLAKRIDKGFEDLKESHKEMLQRISFNAKSIENLEDRLTPVEASVAEYKEIRKIRKSTINKILMGVALAAAAVVGTLIGQRFVVLVGF